MTGTDAQLRSDDLFASLVEEGDAKALSLLWRADQPELAVRLAPYFASARVPALTELLLDELSDPLMAGLAAVRTAILAAIAAHLPPLTKQGIDRLNEALRDAESSDLVPDTATQAALEPWLFAQTGKVPDEYALFVIEAEFALAPAAATLKASLDRCTGDARLRARAAAVYARRIEAEADAAAWTRAIGFIETCCTAQSDEPEVAALVQTLIAAAPALAPTAAFEPVLAGLISTHGHDAILQVLDGEGLGSSLGVFGLLAIADAFPRADDRLDIFMAAFAWHPALFPALDAQAAKWPESRWRQVLGRILKTKAEDLPDALSPLLAKAPASLSALLVQIAAVDDRATTDPALPPIVSTRVGEAFAAAVESSAPVAKVLPWPRRITDAHAVYVRHLIANLDPATNRLDLLLRSLEERRVDPTVAAFLLPVGSTRAMIERIREYPVAWPYEPCLAALLADRRDEFIEAAGQLQTAGFDIVLARLLAPIRAQTAFTGAEAAYPTMSTPDRDVLVGLLEAHAEAGQLPLVELFARANDKAERTRRARAFGVAARLLPVGSTPPDYLSDGMRASSAEVSRAAFEAVGRIKPGDLAFLRDLRLMAETDGAISKSAASALETMTSGFIAGLDTAQGNEECRQLLLRLGAAARPAALDVLLGYLGDAPSDDIELHRAAAAAVKEAVPKIRVSPLQLERLGDLLDGDDQERDPQVRNDLSEASMAASLGADAAITLLFELAHFHPTNTPDELFGQEKSILIRQLGLYKREADRGVAGRAVALAHLDLVAERVVRATYAHLGSSEPIKEKIAASLREPDYGKILGALGGPLDKAKPRLQVLHDTRSESTEIPHAGMPLTTEAYNQAFESFRQAMAACLTLLDEAVTSAK